MKEGWDDLKGPKYDWLTNLRNLTRKRQCAFKVLRSSAENGSVEAVVCLGHMQSPGTEKSGGTHHQETSVGAFSMPCRYRQAMELRRG